LDGDAGSVADLVGEEELDGTEVNVLDIADHVGRAYRKEMSASVMIGTKPQRLAVTSIVMAITDNGGGGIPAVGTRAALHAVHVEDLGIT